MTSELLYRYTSSNNTDSADNIADTNPIFLTARNTVTQTFRFAPRLHSS